MATTTATIDISVARNEFHRLDQRLAESQVLYVTRHHQPAFAVISPEYLEGLLETLDILSEPGAIEMLQRSIRDIREGRTFAHQELEAEFG